MAKMRSLSNKSDCNFVFRLLVFVKTNQYSACIVRSALGKIE